MSSRKPVYALLLILSLALGCGDDGDGGEAPDAADSDAAEGDDAGTSGQPDAQVVPDAAPAGTLCQVKDPVVQVGYTCQLAWSECTGGGEYAIDCRIENVAGNVFSLCDCIENGTETVQFISSDVCSQADWASVEAIVNEECGWDLI